MTINQILSAITDSIAKRINANPTMGTFELVHMVKGKVREQFSGDSFAAIREAVEDSIMVYAMEVWEMAREESI